MNKRKANWEALQRLLIYNGDYLGLAEFAQVLGISRQALSNRRARGQLPIPTVELKMSPIWTKAQLKLWVKAN